MMTNQTPTESNDLFAPARAYGDSAAGGQYTTYKVDGITVPADYLFATRLNNRHGSLGLDLLGFSVIESYRIKEWRFIGADGFDRRFPVGHVSQLAVDLLNRGWANGYAILDDSWSSINLLAPQTQQQSDGEGPTPDDKRYSVEDLVNSAKSVIKNATGKCAELLGAYALSKFDRISKDIKYDNERLNLQTVVGFAEARTIGEHIYLNPWSVTFNEDFQTPRSEDVRLSKVQLKYNKAYNKGLRDYQKRLEKLGVSSNEYAVAAIIHEFLHAIGKFGSDSDGVDSDGSIRNQEEVIKKCFTQEK